MLEKEFVPYEWAVKLKELGFDEPCFGWWFTDEEMLIIEKSKKSTSENIIQAPTFSQAFRWFRENYETYYTIEGSKKHGFQHFIYFENEQTEIKSRFTFENHEAAELDCLRNLIEIV
jgi:hypothetical protein